MYVRTTTASRRALARETVRYRNVSVPLVFVPEEVKTNDDGTVTITPAHLAASAQHTTFNIGSNINKGYKRALRIARRRVMRVLRQQGRPFTGKVSLNALMQAA